MITQTGPYSVRIVMDDKEQFTNLVAKHASGLTEEQLAGYPILPQG
ncbi:hypothetical protein [Enterobacter hormaechei]|nr:hypothetical protein [Enterobacter hormaechei]